MTTKPLEPTATELAAFLGDMFPTTPATPETQAIIDSVAGELATKGYQQVTAVAFREMPHEQSRVMVTVTAVDGAGATQRADVQLTQSGTAWAIDRIYPG